MFKKKQQQKREEILEKIQNKLDEQINSLCSSNNVEPKNFNKLIELLNATIRLEQAEKRFGVNSKIAILSAVTSILTSSFFALFVKYITNSK
ncbi:hypothetical protein SAMN05720469_10946 [Fibrobacter intestinalis]|uniref:Uncharacterized protein n=1 Tax=Fibrobacter intestinalis TaxID=28122 RepID=A0A1M6TAB1_9BACT|nr:hypothetical protein [Fibrobacter intestinalis]SHK53923.1 hypothetical protein SAMN05720469_10946 [Fibrobacter intestinalis]